MAVAGEIWQARGGLPVRGGRSSMAEGGLGQAYSYRDGGRAASGEPRIYRRPSRSRIHRATSSCLLLHASNVKGDSPNRPQPHQHRQEGASNDASKKENGAHERRRRRHSPRTTKLSLPKPPTESGDNARSTSHREHHDMLRWRGGIQQTGKGLQGGAFKKGMALRGVIATCMATA